MDKKQVYTIAGVIVLLIIIGMSLLFEIRKVPDYSEKTKYHLEEKDPLDAYVFAQLLEERFGKENVKLKNDSTALDSTIDRQLYLSIGSSIRYSSKDEEDLINFIKSGNDALLISGNTDLSLPVKVNSKFYDSDEDDWDDTDYTYIEEGYDEEYYDEDNTEKDDTLKEYTKEEEEEEEEAIYAADSTDQTEQVESKIRNRNINGFIKSFYDTILHFDFVQFDSSASYLSYTHYGKEFKKPQRNNFKHFKGLQLVDRDPLIFTKHRRNIFCKIKIGNGNLYIHTAPELFTNLATQQPFYLKHYNKVFSSFDVDKVIIDEPDPLSYLFDRKDQKSPLQYILSVPSLSWAYYLLIVTLILFVIFRGKRTQRIIPTIQKNTNTSMEYIKTLSVLHQNQGQNSKLIKHIREGFYHRIKVKYFLDHKDEFFKEKLAAKSKIEITEIENLLHKLHSTGGAEFSDDQLITLYKQIESFYKKAA